LGKSSLRKHLAKVRIGSQACTLNTNTWWLFDEPCAIPSLINIVSPSCKASGAWRSEDRARAAILAACMADRDVCICEQWLTPYVWSTLLRLRWPRSMARTSPSSTTISARLFDGACRHVLLEKLALFLAVLQFLQRALRCVSGSAQGYCLQHLMLCSTRQRVMAVFFLAF
jgi:hypothetical protein